MQKNLTAILIGCLFVAFGKLTAQTKDPKSDAKSADAKIKIFLNCNRQWLCDEEFLRTELKMVDYVRDRFAADVQVVVNTQFSGGGGDQNDVAFVGLQRFSGKNDTLRYFNNPTTTDDERRRRLLQFMKLGLMRYIAQSSLAEKLQINFTEDDKAKADQASAPARDTWNYWQFSLGASGFFDGDKNYSSSSIDFNVSANRETEKSRFNLSASNNFNHNTYTVSDTEKVSVNNDNQRLNTSYVQKLSEHFAVGVQSNVRRSVFENIDFSGDFVPRVEYSFLPYKKFNSERVVLKYTFGPQFQSYRDTTIYEKKREVQLQQSLGIIGSFNKTWGSVNIGATFTHYLSDIEKNNLFIGGGISWRVFKGFQFAVGGNFSFVHDQLSLPKSGASRDDLLIKRRLIASTYNYFMGVGFSYRFGSIYNSQVNPTFKGLNYSLNF